MSRVLGSVPVDVVSSSSTLPTLKSPRPTLKDLKKRKEMAKKKKDELMGVVPQPYSFTPVRKRKEGERKSVGFAPDVRGE
jgi:hypothetical protein